MITINYISNLDVNEHSGGWSGMNHHVFLELSKNFSVHRCDKINPPYSIGDRFQSKLFRSVGWKGSFPAFSVKRLKKIAESVEECMSRQAAANFFHGATPWLLVKDGRPYSLYLDCCFATYLAVYHQPQKFDDKQVNDLYCREADFLNNAQYVFFSSKWALNDCKNRYGIDGKKFVVAGLGGALDFSSDEKATTGKYFLFVALDFAGKGGKELVNAIREVRKRYPEYTLKIAGAAPPAEYITEGISYEGRLNKSNKEDLGILKRLFANAFCFVLPTKRDMTPLVLVEAMSAGVPVISTNSFGIPELVTDGETGILLNAEAPLQPQLVNAMCELISTPSLRDRLSKNALRRKNSFNWQTVGEIISGKLLQPSNKWQQA